MAQFFTRWPLLRFVFAPSCIVSIYHSAMLAGVKPLWRFVLFTVCLLLIMINTVNIVKRLVLDRCRICNFIARFYRATLWHDKLAVCKCACRTPQLCRINQNSPISVYRIFATVALQNTALLHSEKKSCATVEKLRSTPCHTCDFVARQSCAIKLQVLHRL